VNGLVSWAARAAGVAVAVLASGVVLAAAAWRATGGRWFVVDTPSMGPAATVGTLLLDRPAGRLRVGELITFRPPGSTRIFTHRIAALLAGGRITTKGDINSSPDGWALTRADVVGRVDLRLWDVGWLVRALPILAVGAAAVWVVSRVLADAGARPLFRLTGLLLVLAASLAVLRPLVGSTVVTFAEVHGAAYGTVVSTGILPVSVHALGGSRAVLADGHVATVVTRVVERHHRFEVSVVPHWTVWSLLCIAALCISPSVFTLLVGIDEKRPALA
jgi:hypothetical protein